MHWSLVMTCLTAPVVQRPIVSGATWSRATIPESAGSCRRPAQSLPTSVSIVTPTARATVPANNCRSTDISSCCITALELIAIRHSSIFISVCLPSTSQNIFSPVFTWHYPLITLRPHGLCNSFAILATLNIFIDIYIDVDSSHKQWDCSTIMISSAIICRCTLLARMAYHLQFGGQTVCKWCNRHWLSSPIESVLSQRRVQGQSPGRRFGGWSSLQTLFTYFDCRNYQSLKIVRTIHLLILDQYVSRWGLSDIFPPSRWHRPHAFLYPRWRDKLLSRCLTTAWQEFIACVRLPVSDWRICELIDDATHTNICVSSKRIDGADG